MIIVACPACQAKYKIDETKLGDRRKARSHCAKCGGTIEIENPLMGSFTLPPGVSPPGAAPPPEEAETPPPPTLTGAPPSARRTPQPPEASSPRPSEAMKRTAVVQADAEVGSATITGKDLHSRGVLELPKDKRFSLAVIQGAATGHIFQINKTRTTIGRAGADINLEDPEASRTHASVEIVGETVMLRDLGSTNGTWVDMERIEQHSLSNQMEFRIGSHVLMFIVTEIE